MELENPRTANDNLATIYTWHPKYGSPDENPYKTIEDFALEWLVKLYPGKGELAAAIEAWPDSGLDHRVYSYPSNTIVFHDIDPTEWLAEALAAQPEAIDILAAKMAIRNVYILDHSAVHYSTTPFNDLWDSGMVGIAFIDPSNPETEQMSIEQQLACIDAEVSEYDGWLNGEFDEDADWSDVTGLRCPECGHTANFTANCVILDGSVHISPEGWDWSEAGQHSELPEHVLLKCDNCGHKGRHREFSVEHADDDATDADTPRHAYGTVIMKGACAVDGKGRDIMPGDTVFDSFCKEHKVLGVQPIDAESAWLVTDERVLLIPHLTEKKTD